MLGIDRQAARYVWTAAVIILLLVALYLIRKTLFVFIVALLFAYLLSPLVDLLDRFLPTSRTRTPALVVAYLIVMGGLVFGVIILGSRIADEARAFNLRDLINRSTETAPAPAGNTILGGIVFYVQSQIRQHAGEVVAFLPRAGLRALSIASDLIYIIIIPILSFFFLKDGRVMREKLLDLIGDGPRRDLAEDVAREINVLLAQYMRALTVLSLFTLTFYSFFFSVTHVPYAMLLSALAALLEFIPMIGPFSAAVIVVLVSVLTGYPYLLWILIFMGVYRVFQDYVLSPRLLSEGMELHPLLVMFGVFAGAEIGGVPGTFLSVPLLALIRILYRRLERARRHIDLQQLAP
ncbi:MAG TPA: AI-2E family transporter [Vicinamibacterales bacterium]|nr:AI-2E family transporter [Vicinamibacterales bacterium]